MPVKIRLLIISLILCTSAVWLTVFSQTTETFKIIACDVGQGDAFLIMSQNNQILIDGGPDEKIINCLEKNMPYWDKTIELIILTHPQKDHFNGLIQVFQKYTVETFLENPLQISSSNYQLLKSQVLAGGSRVIAPSDDLKIRLGLIYLDILWPKSEYTNDKCIEKSDSSQFDLTCSTVVDVNEFSIVALIRFKEIEALFTGDIDPKVSDMIAADYLLHHNYDAEYIKVPHHGSKNGISSNLLDALRPDAAIISVGKNNSYGHPHQEIIKMLNDRNIKILRTDELGDVVVEYE